MPLKIVTYQDYVAGWLDTSLPDFLEAISLSTASTKYALITCLDSNPNPASLRSRSPELKSLAKSTVILGTGLLLRTELLLEANARKPIFFGFDEVWFFPKKSVTPKPESLTLVGPARINQVRVNKLGKWMSENVCSMALGGGEGLNFIVRAHGLGKFLLGYSIEQPEPVMATSEPNLSR